MRKQEQRLWDTMRRQLTKYNFWLQRVENVATTGMPDTYVVRKLGRASWVELKAPTRPKRPTTPLLGDKEGLNPDQVNWMIDATRRGLSAYVLVRDSEGNLFLVESDFATTINQMTCDEFEEYRVSWDDVGRLLL